MHKPNVRFAVSKLRGKALPKRLIVRAAPKKRTGPIKTPEGTRVFARPEYRSFRMSPRIRHPKPRIISSFRLAKQSLAVVRKRWKLFAGIALVYLLLSLVLVKGFGSSMDVQSIKDMLSEVFHGKWGTLIGGLTIFSALMSSTGSAPTEVAGAYQTVLLLLVSLALIWALRQTMAGSAVRVKDAYYKGTAPLVPFTLVLVVVGLQLVPVVLASFLYSLVYGNGLAVTAPEKLLWALLIALMALWSLYMVASSLFALYIVALPDMTPMKALRSARGLVRYRRWTVMRRIVFLPIALVVVMAIIMLPIILVAAPVAEWVFYSMTTLSVVVIHSYMYSLYRELIK